MSIMYVPYHMHSMLSNGTTNIDSITNFRDYVKVAADCGMPALGISEHGNIFEWLHKKEAIEKAGMKYIHCVEAYITADTDDARLYSADELFISTLTKNNVRIHFKDFHITEDGKYIAIDINTGKECWIDESTIKEEGFEKTRDNYHCVLIAKNYDGVKEINRMTSKSFNRDDCHFYYMPRITFDELYAISDNVIITTACLGGVLHNGDDIVKEQFLTFLANNKHRCYLEIQHHNIEEQIEYNKYLYAVSKATGVPLIVGTDTHALNELQMEGRSILQAAKDVHFDGEDSWDLVFKTPEELLNAYKRQGSLPIAIIEDAMQNSIKMAESIEPFDVDHSPKYPKLYDDSEAVFKEKINQGVVSRGIMSKPNYQEYVDRIHYEYDTYKHNGAIDFMLLEEDYKSEMRRQGIRYGYSRGSVSGSIIAYLLGITEIDSVKFDLNFERFMNKERVSLADVDSDWYSEDRKAVREYLYHKDGLYCCDIVTFNTIALKGAIRDIVRGLFNINVKKMFVPDELKQKIKKWEKEVKDSGTRNPKMPESLEKEYTNCYNTGATYKEVPYNYIKFAEELIDMVEKDEESARKKYKRIFKYVDLVNGVVVSVGNHPAGCVVSPYPVEEWFGTFTTKTNDYPISVLNMKEIDSLNFVKLDILGLDNVGLIYKTCDLAGIPYATPDNIPPDDENVWKSIREDTTMIFQWESPSATAYLQRLFSDSTIEKIRAKNPDASYMDLLSIGNGAIRPAGESYRDKLSNGEYALYGNEALDDFLKPTLGWLVYQEQIIEFLHKFCGFTMGEADIVRRHFSKKTGTDKDIPIIKNGGYLNDNHYIKGFIQTMYDDYGVEQGEAEKLIVGFLQVIIDASDYLFSKNHADPYSWIGYICGYLRYYYPLEFITSALNIFIGKEDKTLAITEYAKKRGIKISSIKFRHSTAEYAFDKETNTIFKGIESIKFMNSKVAEISTFLSDKSYVSFIDCISDFLTGTSVNMKQMRILIDLDFFEEFGDANYLNMQLDLFDKYGGRSQINKTELAKLHITDEEARSFSMKETAKMFSGIDSLAMLRVASKKLKYKRRTLKEKINAQIEHLSYVDIVGDQYSGIACVTAIDTKYSPRLTLYSLKNGTSYQCKIDKRTFSQNKLAKGDILRVLANRFKPKVKKNEQGEWEEIPDTRELWITKYKRLDNL